VRLQFDDRRTRLVLLYLLNSNPGVFRRSTSAVRAMSMALSVKAGRSASCSAQAQICDLIHIYTASLWTVSLCRTTARPSFTNWRISTGVEVTAPLSVTEMGFSLHAATTASAEDSRGREALVRYALRPPIAQERLHILPDNLVRIELRRPFRDGDAEEWLKNQTLAIDLDPLSLLCRLAASVPLPGFHLVHYAGVLASASKLRALVAPPAPPEFTAHAKHSHREQPPNHRSRYRPWAELLKRTFQIDVERCECGGRFKLLALVIARICPATPKRLIAVTPSPYESLGQSRLDPQLY